jgi:hypothetical protein
MQKSMVKYDEFPDKLNCNTKSSWQSRTHIFANSLLNQSQTFANGLLELFDTLFELSVVVIINLHDDSRETRTAGLL